MHQRTRRVPGVYASTGVLRLLSGRQRGREVPPSRSSGGAPRGRRSRRLLTPSLAPPPSARRSAGSCSDPSTGELADRTPRPYCTAPRPARRSCRSPCARAGARSSSLIGTSTPARLQGAGHSLDAAELSGSPGRPTDPRPHLTVLLDTRSGRRAGPGSLSGTTSRAESIGSSRRVRGEFLEAAEADPDHYLVLDARAPVEEEYAESVHDRVSLPSSKAHVDDVPRTPRAVSDGSSVSLRSSNAPAGCRRRPVACLAVRTPGWAGHAAIAFAAGLRCGRVDAACPLRTTGSRSARPDVRVTRTEKLSIGVDEVRDLVRSLRRSRRSATAGR